MPQNSCRVAELSLLGAIGCGTWLVKTLLAELEDGELAGEYDMVVLQATDTSLPFYEKLGFRRVGALARYARPGATNGPEAIKARKEKQERLQQEQQTAGSGSRERSTGTAAGSTVAASSLSSSSHGGEGGLPSPLNDPLASRVVGFRHWTFSDEPLRSDVEVSKMMVRRIHHARPRGAAAKALYEKAKASAEKAAQEVMQKEKAKKGPKRKHGNGKNRKNAAVENGGTSVENGNEEWTAAAATAAKAASDVILRMPLSQKAVAKAQAAREGVLPNLDGQVS